MSMARPLRASTSHSPSRRQQATANSSIRRSPAGRARKSTIRLALVLPSHSASVMALPQTPSNISHQEEKGKVGRGEQRGPPAFFLALAQEHGDTRSNEAS